MAEPMRIITGKTDLDRLALIQRAKLALLDVAVAYVREGQEGTMRDRLRRASEASGLPLQNLAAEVGVVERIKANYGDKTPVVEKVVIEKDKKP